MNEPRAYTEDEMRDQFLDAVRRIARFWADLDENKTSMQDRCDGVAFSVLSLMDGCNIGLPPVDLVFRPHPSDKQYHIDEGENWIEDGTTLSTMLHEHFYKKG